MKNKSDRPFTGPGVHAISRAGGHGGGPRSCGRRGDPRECCTRRASNNDIHRPAQAHRLHRRWGSRRDVFKCVARCMHAIQSHKRTRACQCVQCHHIPFVIHEAARSIPRPLSWALCSSPLPGVHVLRSPLAIRRTRITSGCCRRLRCASHCQCPRCRDLTLVVPGLHS